MVFSDQKEPRQPPLSSRDDRSMSMLNNLEEEREIKRSKPLYKVRKALEFLSIGKYSMKFYDEDRSGYFTSWLGGLITILCGGMVAYIALIIIMNTYHQQNVYVDESAVLFKDSVIGKMTTQQ